MSSTKTKNTSINTPEISTTVDYNIFLLARLNEIDLR
jgi:hypothetical protein